jgi:hypothetical protein
MEQLMEAKAFVKEGSGASFQTPRQYFEPFMEVLEQNGVFRVGETKIQVNGAVVNKNEDGTENRSYERILVQGKLEGIEVPGFSPNVGMIVALDVVKPVIKVYSGFEASACTNLCIFRADRIHEQSVSGNIQGVYAQARHFIEQKEREVETFRRVVEHLHNKRYSFAELQSLMGGFLLEEKRHGLGTVPIVQAAKRMGDRGSQYYADPTDGTTAWNVYSAITQTFTNQEDVLNTPNKVLKAAKLFGIGTSESMATENDGVLE